MHIHVKQSKWLPYILASILLILTVESAAGIFDDIKSIIQTKSNNVKENIEDHQQRKAEEKLKLKEQEKIAQEALLTLPSDLPKHWQLSFQREPVFNSKVLIAEIGNKKNQTLILIHGLGQNGLRDWLNVIPALEDSYHIITLDLPGFGSSAKPPGYYSPTNYAHLIHWLKNQYSSEEIYVIGHSMGGATALRYSALFETDVKATILVDAAGILERTAFVKHNATIPVDVEKLPSTFRNLTLGAMDFTGAMIEKLSNAPDPTQFISNNEDAWNLMFSNIPNANAALSLVSENFSDAIYNYKKHTILIWGEKDTVAPLRTARLLNAKLQSSQLKIIVGAAHVPMNSHPDEFNQILLSALAIPFVADGDIEILPSNSENLECNHRNGDIYSGTYKTVVIDHCKNIIIKNLRANELTIRDSLVHLENVVIQSNNIALNTSESVIIATNAEFTGTTAIQTTNSRLDLAGVKLTGEKTAVEIKDNSRLVISISELYSHDYQGYLHGDYKIEHDSLDQAILKAIQ